MAWIGVLAGLGLLGVAVVVYVAVNVVLLLALRRLLRGRRQRV